MIDLRSDTLTRPTERMRQAMAAAEVGDDVYGEDPTIGSLEKRVAELLGKESALFCVSGSLANLLGVRAHVQPGEEVLCDVQAHIARAEMGAHAAVHGITMRTWGSDDGVVAPAQVDALVAPPTPYLVATRCVALENTHNFGGGTVQPPEQLAAWRQLADAHGVALHLDGARLWNAHVATGATMQELAGPFDTVSVCFSKGLAAPVGSVLCGSAEAIAGAREQRKRLGAGWRQAGVLAAACHVALDDNVARLADDHRHARALAEAVASGAGDVVDEVPTNIVLVRTGGRATAVVAALRKRGVLMSALNGDVVRAVTHLDVTGEQCRQAGEHVADILGSRT